MIKSILVPLLGDKSDEFVLEYARTVANQFHAHIDALHVSHNPVDEVLRLTIGDGVITRELWRSIASEVADRRKNARACFDRFCEFRAVQILDTPRLTSAITASWHLVEGELATVVALKGRFNELVVVDRDDAETGFTPGEMAIS